MEGQLVPAATVTPAPMAYTKIVAGKMVIVGFWNEPVGLPQDELLTGLFFFAKTAYALY